jgi:MOSC domain-containing protein YiiM
MTQHAVEIVALLASPLHRYEGRPADGPLPAPPGELAGTLRLRAGLGVAGDRYFGQRAHRDSSVTVQSAEALEAVAAELGAPVPGLEQTRRNVLLRGFDVEALLGAAFSLDSGSGEVRFGTARACRPCGWLDATIADGARRAFRQRGGIRTAPLTDGVLRLGPAVLRIEGANAAAA